jgi:hypothetical protein
VTIGNRSRIELSHGIAGQHQNNKDWKNELPAHKNPPSKKGQQKAIHDGIRSSAAPIRA